MSLASACEADAGGALTACWSSEPVSSDFSLVGGTAGARWVGSLRTELHLDGYSRNNSDKLRSPCDSVIPAIKNIYNILFIGLFSDECLPNVAISNSNIPKDQLEGHQISALLEAVNN